ncbi:aminodeoxychorismate synthase component I [Altererythrobacter xixiisoli]|uniref:Probable branched-chain-amino-acid aminotransferase n=1 Tax=Croceibacterium xixiisoli TaxID=1476466 RepID=A0A6I4TRA9_9SPHN|nr:aminodeoxychorismate synthase component I [Croceibacterium xixiisoli]MXO97661.1 aminodeoxychorismate synthase component I [Croceibacterium xixiisoli]
MAGAEPTEPFVLLDDARAQGASDAQLFENPRALFIAHRPEDVAPVLAAAEAARRESGGTLAGYLTYEAGLALEAKLEPLASGRSGSTGPLVWFGLFDAVQTIAAADVPQWLATRAGDSADGPASIGPLEPQLSIGGYCDVFDRLQDAIHAGDIYQANLTMPLAGPARGDPVALYAAMRPGSNAGYGGLIFDGGNWLLSFSPELFFSLRGRAAKCKPMKGTRPRGRTDQEDAALAQELAASVKDRAENLMIVDLMRNDLSRVAVAGSVQVEQPFEVETYPTVHTMVTTVRAQLQDGLGAMDMIHALFPCGSITGAPKIRAMELIDEVERDARGPYCGAIGRIDGNGDAAFNVAIRTIHLTPGENQRHKAVLGVGGAIVADSEALSEWRECLVKGGFARGAAGGHDLIESMRFDPADGIPLLEQHLERMKTSAGELGFAFDRHDIRNRIQALCFELDQPAKVRLLLARSGETALESVPLPAPADGPIRCIALPLPVVSGDWRLRHKTTDRSFYEQALAVAKAQDAGEALLVRPDGLVTEGSFTNIFIERDGTLLTPPAHLGLLPGVLRWQMLEDGRAVEAELTLDDLQTANLAGGFFLGNAVRGLMRAEVIS